MKKYIEPSLFVVEVFEEVVRTSSGYDTNETKLMGTFEDLFTMESE